MEPSRFGNDENPWFRADGAGKRLSRKCHGLRTGPDGFYATNGVATGALRAKRVACVLS
jgi:hypothetical protein